MARYIIHYTENGVDGHFSITGDDERDIRQRAEKELRGRGLDVKKNEVWSEKLND